MGKLRACLRRRNLGAPQGLAEFPLCGGNVEEQTLKGVSCKAVDETEEMVLGHKKNSRNHLPLPSFDVATWDPI